MEKAYYGSKISKNMLRTPEKFLICKNVPIARTGVQRYLGKEIGLDGDKAEEIVKVYRIEEEVFNPRTMASFEGKAFTEEHPDSWVGPTNAQVYLKGAITNVRRGDGNESDLLLADIIVYNEQQIREIEDREKREVSCGYECEYVKYKDGYKQTGIIGNHVALVSAGRAGNRVSIRDNNIDKTSNERRQNNMENGNGYKLPRRQKAKDFLYGIGLKHFAIDADPEDMAEAVDELVSEKLEEKEVTSPATQEEVSTPITEDEDGNEELLAEIASLKATIESLMDSEDDVEDDDYEDELEEPDGLDSLEELEEELETSDDESEEVESVEEDPDTIDEEYEDFEDMKTTDSIKELTSVLKMVVANIPDSKQRKKTADALAKVLRKHAHDAKIAQKIYGDMLNRTKDSKDNNVDYGMEIAKRFNPHYKETK